jgi:DNA-directed RNA polymerase specialized sigma24 family protein
MGTAADEQVTDVALPAVERDRLERELGRLPIEQRAELVVRFYLVCPISEVPDVLGIPFGTAKSRLNRGLAALRAGSPLDAGVQPRPIAVRTP